MLGLGNTTILTEYAPKSPWTLMTNTFFEEIQVNKILFVRLILFVILAAPSLTLVRIP